jgi:hypothetical protein
MSGFTPTLLAKSKIAFAVTETECSSLYTTSSETSASTTEFQKSGDQRRSAIAAKVKSHLKGTCSQFHQYVCPHRLAQLAGDVYQHHPMLALDRALDASQQPTSIDDQQRSKIAAKVKSYLKGDVHRHHPMLALEHSLDIGQQPAWRHEADVRR